MFSRVNLLLGYSFFRVAAGLSVILLVFLGLFWMLATSVLEDTFFEANVAELYSLSAELERGDLHAHGDDVLWGVGDDIDPLIYQAFQENQGELHQWATDEAGDEREQDLFDEDDPGDGDRGEVDIFEFVHHGHHYIGEMSVVDGQLQYVALNVDHQFERIDDLNIGLFSVAVVTFISAAVLSYLFAVASQRKLVKIQAALSQLSAGDMGARCALPPGRDDISELAQSLDRALARLEIATEQTRLFGKNLAHDLRTPLARLRAHLERVEPHSDQLVAALREVDRVASIIDAMMRIARLQVDSSTVKFAPVNLARFAQRLHETYAPVLPAHKHLVLKVMGDSSVNADEVLLEQAVTNLLQNAIVYGGDTITLFTSAGEVGISDDGPGVPEAQFEEIIKPSVRLDSSRGSDGAGLGLAFVKAVSDHHGSALMIEALQPHGLKVSMRFDKTT